MQWQQLLSKRHRGNQGQDMDTWSNKELNLNNMYHRLEETQQSYGWENWSKGRDA